jgi:hypothetical protein
MRPDEKRLQPSAPETGETKSKPKGRKSRVEVTWNLTAFLDTS